MDGDAISDSTPIWLNPMGAPEKNLPPAMAVVGEPGSGKTFILQALATQFAKGGHHVVYINPKPADSLSGFCHAIGGEVIKMSSSASNAGRLDPFRYAKKKSDAAQIAISHIQSVIDLDQMAEMELEAGIMRAANAGASCVWDALQNEKIPHGVREMIENVCEGRPLFAPGHSDGATATAEHDQLSACKRRNGIADPCRIRQTARAAERHQQVLPGA